MNFTAQSIKPTVQFDTAEISIIDDDRAIQIGKQNLFEAQQNFSELSSQQSDICNKRMKNLSRIKLIRQPNIRGNSAN